MTEERLSRDTALKVVRDAIEPGAPTLGMWFGWNQPGAESTVKLGSAYGSVPPFTMREVLSGSEIGYSAASEIIRAARECRVWTDLNREIELGGLVSCDEVFIPFTSLSPDERALHRLKVMLVNTFTDGHNWACEWGDYLAAYYASHKDAECSAWEGYDCSPVEFDLITLLSDWDVMPRVNVWEDRDYAELGGSAESVEYALEHVDGLFPELPYNFQKQDVSEVLAWALDWLIEEHSKGHLEVDLTAVPN